jgi:arylsulfatase A-like enzyme
MRKAGVAALVVVALAAGVWVWRQGGIGSASRPRSVLLISVDTLRADRLGSYGYTAASTPVMDGLAARGLRFAQATTVVPLTLPAHTSLLTGTFPTFHGVRDNSGYYAGDSLTTLAETLKPLGYRTGGFVGAFVLDGRWGLAQGFDYYFDDFDLADFDMTRGLDTAQRPGAAVVDKALAWLGDDRERPFFAWVHLYDPHSPYEPPEPYRTRFSGTMQRAYDGEIAATDAQIGRLLSALESTGQLDSTLVVLVGDHGESLGEHGELQHGFFVYDAAVHIPLIIAGPGVPTRTITDQVRIVDVMPTVLDLLGVPAPAETQGQSLLALPLRLERAHRGPRRPVQVHRRAQARAL